jgi:hypothetical protein
VAGARRGWREMLKGADGLSSITDARVAVFVNLDEDGTLDVMVRRTGDQVAGRVLFVQNNFDYDAFFMKKYSLILRWTAGHVGIAGNELADKEAKRAAAALSSDKKLLHSFLK